MHPTLHRLSLLGVGLCSALQASTHGDHLIGAGARSRALGGVGAAVAPGVTAAIFSNPATLGFLAPGELRETELSLAFFQPRFTGRAGAGSAESDTIYAVPAIGVAGSPGPSEHSTEAIKPSPWRYGFATYVVSGLGGDYRDSALDAPLAPTPFPLVATTRAELQVLEFAPSVSYLVSPAWSAGLALHLDRGSFNLGRGRQTGFGAGFQPGLVYRPSSRVTLGLTYVSPSTIDYENLVDFDNDGSLDDFTLESPPQFKIGAAGELLPDRRLRIAADLSWFQWSEARGYRDFGWRDSWLFGTSVEFQAVPDSLVLRAGYNYGPSPVRPRDGFNGAGVPGNTAKVQGKSVPTYYYEAFRVISFPAIAEHHLSIGLGWRVNETWTVNLGYTHAFKNTLVERGTHLPGAPTVLSSSLAEDSVELGLAHRY